MDQPPSVFEIPELSGLISLHLDRDDIARLCLTCKCMRDIFHSLLWQDFILIQFDYFQSTFVTATLTKNLGLLRSVELHNDMDMIIKTLTGNLADFDFYESVQPEPDPTLPHCNNQLRKFSYLQTMNTEWLNETEDLFNTQRRLVKGILQSNQHQLTELRFHTRLVLSWSQNFLDGILSLSQIGFLEISMNVEEHAFPTAITLLIELLDRHPSLGTVLFGDWIGGRYTRNYDVKDNPVEASVLKDDALILDAGALERKVLKSLERRLEEANMEAQQSAGHEQQQSSTWARRTIFTIKTTGAPVALSLASLSNLVSRHLFSFWVSESTHTQDTQGERYNRGPNGGRTGFTGYPIRRNDLQDDFKIPLWIQPGLRSLTATSFEISNLGEQIMHRHSSTLTTVILNEVRSIMSHSLHEILKVCSALKCFKVESRRKRSWHETNNAATTITANDGDLYQDCDYDPVTQGVWSCTTLELLTLVDCGITGKQDLIFGAKSDG
ncbi:hypothetical protein BGZ83_001722 [Gryganskiella cystojenkinii]|nr:hypothetical protein BGZ83_001722 [Gryganskiella cystojenkinii]